MRVLLDTHVVIWLSTEPSRVPDHLQKLVLEADQRFISVVSFFEVALKHRKDPESFPFTFEFLTGAMGDLQAMELQLGRDHIRHVGTIPVLHKDPFDHLLMAQAIEEELVFVTMDASIENYELNGLILRNRDLFWAVGVFSGTLYIWLFRNDRG